MFFENSLDYRNKETVAVSRFIEFGEIGLVVKVDVDEVFEKPSWLGEEVTGNPMYYNASLSKLPFSLWK